MDKAKAGMPPKSHTWDDYLNPLDRYDKGTAAQRRLSRIGPLPEDADFIRKTLSDGATIMYAKTKPKPTGDDEGAPSAGSRRFSVPTSLAKPADPGASPASRSVRRNSQQAFAEKQHVTLVLDWDDTLFPTTWVREDCKLDWRYSPEQQLGPGPRLEAVEALLEKHLMRVAEFLNDAADLANIFIVTLARRPWVENSMDKFMPKLQAIIEKHALKVIYAQECADPKEVVDYMRDGAKTPEEGQDFWTRVKGTAIAQELDEFHRKHDASWKNVISLGDSDFERYGTLSAGQDYMKREMEGGEVVQTGHTAEGVSKDGHLKRLRVKTVKMLDKPTVLELTAELTLLRRWLPHIVRRDAGFDVEIDGTDNDGKLKDLHTQVTGEDDPELSWQDLAGMND